MSKITKSERKKIFYDSISNYFIDLGYDIYFTGVDPRFNLSQNELVVHFGFSFFDDGTIGCSPLFITNYEIENFILNTGIPTNKLEDQKKKEKYHLPTIEYRKLSNILSSKVMDTDISIQEFANSYIQFHKTEGTKFINQFKVLPEVLKEMDRLRSKELYWKEILFGGPEHLIKGLIISKICNDPNYNSKLEWIGGYFESKQDEWSPYWEKYRNILDEITPKYSF